MKILYFIFEKKMYSYRISILYLVDEEKQERDMRLEVERKYAKHILETYIK